MDRSFKKEAGRISRMEGKEGEGDGWFSKNEEGGKKNWHRVLSMFCFCFLVFIIVTPSRKTRIIEL